ncbi:MAG: hypothetical protein JNM39_12185 [Bdellovibrionaceae bacterium]|nr:hypothetical protein [Pseudobdellovibrionaceae bacterium]
MKAIVALFCHLSICFSAFAETNTTIAANGAEGVVANDVVHLPNEYSKDLIKGVKAGNIIEFQDGKKYLIQKVLSVESADGIFQLQGNRILRVPMQRVGGDPGFNTINQTLDGYEALKNAGISVPKILEFERGTRVVAEYIDINFKLVDLFNGKVHLSEEELSRVKEEFNEFVKKFRDFNMVADLHKDQIVYSSVRGWVLLDWRDYHRIGRKVNPFIHCWFNMTTEPDLYNVEMVVSWWRSSDVAIASSRGESPEKYFQMDYWQASAIFNSTGQAPPPKSLNHTPLSKILCSALM